jgi:hypothetical protein
MHKETAQNEFGNVPVGVMNIYGVPLIQRLIDSIQSRLDRFPSEQLPRRCWNSGVLDVFAALSRQITQGALIAL